MADTKLLPCPFCGAEATLQYNRVGGALIFCSNLGAVVDCETESPTEADNDETFAAWNTRAPDPRIAAADEMAKALERFNQYHESDFIRVSANDGRTLAEQMHSMHAALAAYKAVKL